MSSPTASRISPSVAAACLTSLGLSTALVGGTGTVLMAVQPLSTLATALATAASAISPPKWV